LASYTKFNQFVEDLAKKVHNLNSDTLKVALTNSAPSASNTIFANITEISAGSGYSAGGSTATFSTGAQTAGTYKLVLADVTFTASGGSIGPFRYVVLYNDTPTSPADPLIGYYDYATNITITTGNSFTVDFDGTAGVFTLA
jgi:flagellar capping protein FliD